MVILGSFALWTFYFWLVQKCLRRSVAGIRIEDRGARLRRPRVQIPDTVPFEWTEAYKAEGD